MYFCPGGQSRTKVESVLKVEWILALPASPAALFLCTFVLFGCFQNLIHVATSIWCSLNHYLAKHAPKRHILPSCGPSWGASAGPEGAAVRVRRFTPCCQSRTGLKVEPKSKRSQSRRVIPCLKVEWFCAKNLRQSRIGFVLFTFVSLFRYIPRIFDHFAWIFVSRDGFGVGIIIRVDVSFLMMTANRSRYSLIYFPLFLGLIPTLFWLKPSFGG